jgi:pyridinium-3,5-biscarboxylic acid mononucleotide sulfurtransferase
MTTIKLKHLDSILKELNSFIVAFSGGLDSTFLLHRARSLKLKDIKGVTIKTPYIPEKEIEEALRFAVERNIPHEIVELPIPEEIISNPDNRCYLCKRILFTILADYARKNGYIYVTDGTNADDVYEYRPGLKALRELGIRSPLMEAGLTKDDVRQISHNEGIKIWNKPANACLLTRLPHNVKVEEVTLKMVEQAESMLMEKGCPGVRVRVHGTLARIECLPGFMEKIIKNPGKEQIIEDLKKIGFRYITLDLEGYKRNDPDKATI